jgi:hypothetical protein
MTIMEVLHRIDSIKPNTYTQNEKIAWLGDLDSLVKREIIDTHVGGASVVFNGYTENTDLMTKLLVPSPYEDVYIFWLESKIDYWNGEVGKYNNSIAMFNEVYSAFARYYNRMNTPLGSNFKYFGHYNATNSTQVTNTLMDITIEEG